MRNCHIFTLFKMRAEESPFEFGNLQQASYSQFGWENPMRRTGFEPVQALSHQGLNLIHLTTLASPHVLEANTELLSINGIKRFIF